MDHNFLNKLWKKPGSSSQLPSSSSKNDPTFKPSLFTNLSKLSTTSFASPSSFYSGKIQYGGAMSASRINTTASPYVVPKVKKRSVKSSTAHGDDKSTGGPLSSTARKILSTLEKMSTPLRDIKKIPPPNMKLPDIFGRQHRKRPLGASALESASRKKVCPPRAGRTFLTRTVNKAANIPLDNSLATHSLVKNLSENEDKAAATSSKAVHKGIPGVLASFTSSAGMKAPTNFATSSGGGKMKNLRKTQGHYSAANKDEVVEEPDLPDITFNVTSLPAFNFNRPDSTSTPAPPKTSSGKDIVELEYTFAPPAQASPKIRRGNVSNTSLTKLNFSSPLKSVSQKNSSSTGVASKVLPKQSNILSPLVSSNEKSLTLKSGSVMDVLKCDMGDKSTTDNSQNSKKPPISDLFKKPSGKWECEVCMVMNDIDKISCVACESLKPGQKPPVQKSNDEKSKLNDLKSNKDKDSVATKAMSGISSKSSHQFSGNVSSFDNSKQQFLFGAPTTNSFGSPPKGSKTATDKNSPISFAPLQKAQPNSALKLSEKDINPALEKKPVTQLQFGSKSSAPYEDLKSMKKDSTPVLKPLASFGTKKSSNSWTCDVCLVPNDTDRTKCVACESPRPGAANQAVTGNTSSTFKFGNTSSIVYKFGFEAPKEQVKAATACVVTTATTFETSSAQAPVTTSTVTASEFNFVAPTAKSTATNEVVVTEGKLNGISKPQTTGFSAHTFSFGSKTSSEINKKSETVQSLAKPSISFGGTSAPATKVELVGQTASSKATFNFGTPTQTAVKTSEGQQQQQAINLSPQFKEDEKQVAFKPMFSNATSSATVPASNGTVVSTATSQTTTLPLFSGFGQQGDQPSSVSSQNTPPATFKFGSQSATAPVMQVTVSASSKPMFSFGNSSSTMSASSPVSQSTNSMFGSKTASMPSQEQSKEKPNSMPTFTGFGQQTVSQPQATGGAKPTFVGFGQQVHSEQKQGNEVSKPAFGSFGQSAPAFTQAQTKAQFSFGSSSSGTSTSAFGKETPSLPKPEFSFGSSAAPTSQVAFGSNAFGSSSANAASSSQSQAPAFQFGSTEMNQKPQANVGFNSAHINSKPSFSFGSASNDNAKPGLTIPFGSQQSNAGFQFGGAFAEQRPTPSAGFNFGSSDASKSTFSSSSQSSTFQFGASNQVNMLQKPDSTTNAGFQFNPNPPSAFGQSAVPSAGPGGFNIGQSGRAATPNRMVKQAKRRLRK